MPPLNERIACIVYKGLVPRTPNIIPIVAMIPTGESLPDTDCFFVAFILRTIAAGFLNPESANLIIINFKELKNRNYLCSAG